MGGTGTDTGCAGCRWVEIFGNNIGRNVNNARILPKSYTRYHTRYQISYTRHTKEHTPPPHSTRHPGLFRLADSVIVN